MPTLPGMQADVYFGSADNETLPDWRAVASPEDENEDAVQPGVLELLGFDPAELDDDVSESILECGPPAG